MRSLILKLALAASARAAVKARTAPRDAAAAFFHNPAATVLHETEAFDAAALPTAAELVRPFAGKFKWPYVDVRRSAEGVTRPTADARGAGAFSTLLLVGSMLLIAGFIVARKATRAAESQPLLATTA